MPPEDGHYNVESLVPWFYGNKGHLSDQSNCFIFDNYIDSKYKYKLGYVKRGSTAFKVLKDGCGVPSAARALLGPEGLLMR